MRKHSPNGGIDSNTSVVVPSGKSGRSSYLVTKINTEGSSLQITTHFKIRDLYQSLSSLNFECFNSFQHSLYLYQSYRIGGLKTPGVFICKLVKISPGCIDFLLGCVSSPIVPVIRSTKSLICLLTLRNQTNVIVPFSEHSTDSAKLKLKALRSKEY